MMNMNNLKGKTAEFLKKKNFEKELEKSSSWIKLQEENEKLLNKLLEKTLEA